MFFFFKYEVAIKWFLLIGKSSSFRMFQSQWSLIFQEEAPAPAPGPDLSPWLSMEMGGEMSCLSRNHAVNGSVGGKDWKILQGTWILSCNRKKGVPCRFFLQPSLKHENRQGMFRKFRPCLIRRWPLDAP